MARHEAAPGVNPSGAIFLILWLLLAFTPSVAAHTKRQSVPAWNGHSTPDAITPKPFRPYYVPPGARSYDSNSPLVLYSGSWTEAFSPSYTSGSVRRTVSNGSSVFFKFTGTGIEVFGTLGTISGRVEVYLDGKLDQTLEPKGVSLGAVPGQRLFAKYDLGPGQHTIKLVNVGDRSRLGASLKTDKLDIDAFVVSNSLSPPTKRHSLGRRNSDGGAWTLKQDGQTGVHAMQLAIISDTHALIVDKVEHNLVDVDNHPAWATLLDLGSKVLTPLRMQSNSFCAGGAWLSDGTLVNVGGNPVVEDHTAAADFGDMNGMQAIRTFSPCDGPDISSCSIYEDHDNLRMASPRWYNTVVRLQDGSAMIIGGSKRGGWINNATTNNPTIEYYPPKSIHGSNGLPITLHMLEETLRSNLFPIAFLLPDGNVFMAANNDAIIYNWQEDKETKLPAIPNGVRVTYPMTGTALLLPLSPENDYTPEVLICGGSTVDDTKPSWELSSQDPASAQCSRMVLTSDGISRGWEVEQMPEARIMPDAVLLPTGQIVIVNGGETGIAGYGNVKEQVGASNADNPVLRPVLYQPNAPSGQRFSNEDMPTSDIPRLYHSVATLTPAGDIMIAGSNPNLDRSDITYRSEYRIEWLAPPYMQSKRMKITEIEGNILYKEQVRVQIDGLGDKVAQVVLMDLGYVTHAVHANSRMVYLSYQVEDGHLIVNGPPNENVYPPGPGWLYLVVGGVPSEGRKVMVGKGDAPPSDDQALQNMLKKTAIDQAEPKQEQR